MSSSRNAEPQLGSDLAVAALIIPITLIGYIISIPAIALGCAVDVYLEMKESSHARSAALGEATSPGVRDLRSSAR
ncbi:MAG TPA: hypothetical protein VHL58_01005 [Thermoanaerobaculia bacterium]|nr:hypothetical protein [Thermoanaerobaculia bacterium]